MTATEPGPAELDGRLDEVIASGDAEGFVALLREADDGEVWREAALLARGALSPIAAGILPRFIAPELLAYDDGPLDPPRGVELLVSLAVAGPWIACTTGWALVVAASSGAAAVARWVRP